jgi:hypothetical protein
MKKAPIALALVLVFGLFAAAFSLGPAIAQNYDPNNPSSLGASSNTTSTAGTSNATGTDNQTSTAAEGSTFSASGRIAAMIYDTADENETQTTSDTSSNMSSSNTTSSASTESSNTTLTQTITGGNDTMTTGNTTFGDVTGADNATSVTNDTATAAEEEVELPYIVSGDWSLDVQDGNVTDFAANFTMVHTDGTGRHTHDVSNFQASNSSAELVQDGVTFIFGTSDVMTNGSSGWTGVDTLIVIENSNAASFTFSTDDDHFKGQPLYGVVDSLTDENGNEMIQTTETASQGGNATGVGGLVDDAANQTGDFLGNLSDSLQNMTGLGQ